MGSPAYDSCHTEPQTQAPERSPTTSGAQGSVHPAEQTSSGGPSKSEVPS